jgi:hypothetical protein
LLLFILLLLLLLLLLLYASLSMCTGSNAYCVYWKQKYMYIYNTYLRRCYITIVSRLS